MKNRMATETPEQSRREIQNAALSRRLAAEGMVLLKNNGCLPLKDVKTIALFGSGARRTVKGGTGSGDVNTRGFVSVEQGLRNAGFEVAESHWLAELDEQMERAQEAYYDPIRSVSAENPLKGLLTMMGNPFRPPVMRALRREELKDADAAVYVLSRQSGEGADRKVVQGDYLLSDHEIADIQLLREVYPTLVLLLNVGGPVEIAPVVAAPDAIVLIGQGGIAAGDAAADVLTGKVNPSGKLTATWAMQFSDYPFAEEFAADEDDAYYREGVFVGYRWFDSFDIAPLYPFGFGKSYTEFRIDTLSASLRGTEITVSARITNTGSRDGRETMQVYAAPPEHCCAPAHALIAFCKTPCLAPGESFAANISFPAEQLASYCEETAEWRIEKGNHILLCGSDSRSAKAFAVVSAAESIVTRVCQNLFRSESIEECRSDRKRASAPEGLPTLPLDPSAFPPAVYDKTPFQIHPKAKSLDGNALTNLCVGAARGLAAADATVIGTGAKQLPGAAGETTDVLPGVPVITMVDGPAGLRINPKIYERDGLYFTDPKDDPIFSNILTAEQLRCDLTGAVRKYQYCTALPIATQLAQTWDLELLAQAGHMVGEEMEELGVELWLAPALNIQRNPLCGRSFEYFSEDPLLSGLCAAAVTRGVQSVPGRGVCIKHLAANNQETNRNYNNSHVSEKALREIYLRGFEICTRESSPVSVMTALNLINGVHASNDADLLTALLRREWGFQGAVMTDWGATAGTGRTYSPSTAVGCILAGNDLIMPGSQRDADQIKAALDDGSLPEETLRICASRVLNMIEILTKEGIR